MVTRILSTLGISACIFAGGCASTAQTQTSRDCVPQAALDAYVQNSIERKADVYASLPVQPGQTLFVGSSLIEEGPWDELFANDAVLNRGISAETTHDLLARVDALSDARPASIFLYTGGNNLSRRNETVEQTLDGIAGVLDALTEARPDTRLYLSTLLPREARYAENVVSVNSGMRRLAEERGITVIDAHAAFADANGALHSDLTNDGIHLNGDGYRIWAAAIADAMDGLQFER